MKKILCNWCNATFKVEDHTNGNYPSYCSDAHYLKAYRSGRRDARVNFKIPTDDTKLAYLAGLIDSDGHISITKSNPTKRARAKSVMYYPLVGVTNTNPAMLEWIVEHYGGTYSERMGTKLKQVHVDNNWKDRYEWRMTGQKALSVLEAIKPYLVVKLDRAELALEFRNHEQTVLDMSKDKHLLLPEWIIEDRERIRNQVMLLNKKGRS